MSGLARLADWIYRHPDESIRALQAANELLALAGPYAAKTGVTPLQLFTGIPAADRALNDMFKIGEIAGRYHVPVESILATISVLKDVALALL